MPTTSQSPHSPGCPHPPLPPHRRAVLRAAAASGLAVLGWQTVFRMPAEAEEDVPDGVACYRQAYRNWSGEIVADDVLTCAPRDVEQAVAVVNWARGRGLRVRPAGMRHGWSPLTIPDGGGSAYVLLDLTQHLTAVAVAQDEHGAVATAQTGTTMESLLTILEEHGYGLTATPAPGDLTLGGVLAIDGHGTAVPVAGSGSGSGAGGAGSAGGAGADPAAFFGSVSNLVTEATAVVWDATQNAYVARTFSRTDPEMGALLVHLGRALLVSATLRVAPNRRLRCVSRTDVSARTLFAAPESAGGHSFAAFVEACGRVETIWFPFTDAPWLKLWSDAPVRPDGARETSAPYNYPFSDELPPVAAELIRMLLNGATWVTPLYTSVAAQTVRTGLLATDSADLWGWAKNTQLYVRPSTLRVTANGYAVLTRRENVQEVVSAVYAYLTSTLADYQAQGRFPVNGPWEVRVTGLDDAGECRIPGAREPLLSALRPRPDRPFDTAVWLDVLTMPGTADADEFYAGFERFLREEFDGADAALRPEWSKGWAYGADGPWTDQDFLHTAIPAAVQAGQAAADGWAAALDLFDRLDPHRVYGNEFLDGFMQG